MTRTNLPDRVVRTTGAANLRDLGGYPVEGGGRVKGGLVYRSDDLSRLTNADVALLKELDIRTVVDFRGIPEQTTSPDRVPDTMRSKLSLPIDPGRVVGAFHEGSLTLAKSKSIMISIYRALISDFKAVFGEFLATISQPASTPLLFHCTAGKDRTGVAAALLLSALGVDRKTVMQDYMLSRDCLRTKYRIGEDFEEKAEPLYSVLPEMLQSALDLVDNEFGGMDNYIDNQLGADRNALKALYVDRNA